MKQQESKVKVKPLRERMAALRGRAVELVGKAFSGGAEDPTALQLQADELYGMEEALGARVNGAFRAQKWRGRALQCVKAAVKRETLLADAASEMDLYAKDPFVKHISEAQCSSIRDSKIAGRGDEPTKKNILLDCPMR